MSLAEKLLADLGDDGDEDLELREEETDYEPNEAERPKNDGEERMDMHGATVPRGRSFETLVLKEIDDVRKMARLLSSNRMNDVLEQIEVYNTAVAPSELANVEDEPEFQLVALANDLATEINQEILLVNKFIKDHYQSRFPELESLVVSPLEYARAVKAIGNEEDITKVNLRSILPSSTVMVVVVTATTTKGKPLPDDELKCVLAACDMALNLDAARRKVLEFVQSRMSKFAPNLSAIVGTKVAADLLGAVGGLSGLARTPSCNVPTLGSKRQRGTGFALAALDRQQGYLYQSEIIMSTPPDLRRQAMRVVSAKVVLAARIDLARDSRDGAQGDVFRQVIETRLDKLAEPPSHKGPRALPTPKEYLSKKRGGRKARLAKKAYGETELSKLQRRVTFGKAEAEIGAYDEMEGLGMLGESSGKVRAAVVDTTNRRAKLSKAGQAKLRRANAKQAPGIFSMGTSGLATSLAFTPVQGIELVDPTKAAAERQNKQEAKMNWFTSGTFTQVSRG